MAPERKSSAGEIPNKFERIRCGNRSSSRSPHFQPFNICLRVSKYNTLNGNDTPNEQFINENKTLTKYKRYNIDNRIYLPINNIHIMIIVFECERTTRNGYDRLRHKRAARATPDTRYTIYLTAWQLFRSQLIKCHQTDSLSFTHWACCLFSFHFPGGSSPSLHFFFCAMGVYTFCTKFIIVLHIGE